MTAFAEAFEPRGWFTLQSVIDAPPSSKVPAPAGIGDRVDRLISKAARCADPRAIYTGLFFSDDPTDTVRAKAICSRCPVRRLCLARAVERREPFGVWGGEIFLDGRIVDTRRGRGRPPKTPPPEVDEVTGNVA